MNYLACIYPSSGLPLCAHNEAHYEISSYEMLRIEHGGLRQN